MFALFEEAGKFQGGRVLSESDASSQVELDSGKRVKVKAANMLLKFEQPAPAQLLLEAQALVPSRIVVRSILAMTGRPVRMISCSSLKARWACSAEKKS